MSFLRRSQQRVVGAAYVASALSLYACSGAEMDGNDTQQGATPSVPSIVETTASGAASSGTQEGTNATPDGESNPSTAPNPQGAPAAVQNSEMPQADQPAEQPEQPGVLPEMPNAMSDDPMTANPITGGPFADDSGLSPVELDPELMGSDSEVMQEPMSDDESMAQSDGAGGSPMMNTEGDGGAPASEAMDGAGGEPSDDDGCPGSGNVSYSFNEGVDWPEDARMLLEAAMEEAVWYYNCYSDLSHTLTVNYKPSVQTAEANPDGWMSFGTDRNYMVVATVMHEIGHTMGVGYFPWTELTDGDRHWTGENVNALLAALPEEEKDPGEPEFITADSLHFWPYGLNYASEHKSEWSLINHVRIVNAMNLDKQAYQSKR